MVIQDAPNPQRVWGKYLAHRHDELKHAQADQAQTPRPHEEGLIPAGTREVIEDLNRDLPVNVPFDPAARLFIEPPVIVQP
jgi:hypothetical protein